jgi:hypothetical protein
MSDVNLTCRAAAIGGPDPPPGGVTKPESAISRLSSLRPVPPESTAIGEYGHG